MMKLPNNVLILDIETAPNLVYVFSLKDQNIGLQQIKKEWYIMAWSAKWLGDSPNKIIYRENREGNDKKILEDLWTLLDKATIVVTQNGKSFDGPKITARMRIHKMKPPSPYQHFDTYLANKGSGFTSHKLGYLTATLNVKYRKLDHSKYPGISLWTECLEGNPDAWKEMKRYNIHDVLSTEELYLNTLEWAPKNMPSRFVTVEKPRCPYCKSYQLRSMGRRKNYRRFCCSLCGKSHQEEISNGN